MNNSLQPQSTNPNSNTVIRLGTRASKLAMWQSTWVKQQLESLGATVELIQIKTEGDVKTGPLAQIGGQGLFTKQLQVALLENTIDLAVHSLKDLPTDDHANLKIAAVPPREETADAWVSHKFVTLAETPDGSVIGTGSVRRAAQLKHLRPDLDIRDIRGNVDTRLSKLDEGQYDAIVLAAAGLKRLGLAERIRQMFEPDQLMPAVGQGALGLETRSDDSTTIAFVAQLNHVESYHRAMAERSLLKALFAGCLAPVGASTKVSEAGELSLTGIVLSQDGKQRLQSRETRPLAEAIELGQAVAKLLVDQGADEFLKR